MIEGSEMLQFTKLPLKNMENEFNHYIAEWKTFAEEIIPQSSDPGELVFLEHLRLGKDFETDEKCPKDFVPASTWFLVNDAGKILGAVTLRYRLNDALFTRGGHIGYGVRPSERRKGYATQMLSFALKKANELGLEKVLITCDKGNIASARTIRTLQGALENEVSYGEKIIQRYWINLT
jgi:predicted acetyltransferase